MKLKKNPTILAIETSCDETAVAVIKFEEKKFKILSNLIFSQVKTHAKFGGVVPEVAARLHAEKILPLLSVALKESKLKLTDLDAIAVTGGPGLITALLVGVETAKSLSLALDLPLIKVNHLEGHLYSGLLANLKDNQGSWNKNFSPAICLIVSGGHTEIILMTAPGKYERIGGTRDDAVGEAFDKVAKMLKLGYPGGPAISLAAEKVKSSPIKLPRPMIDSKDFEMSFSGIKTAVLYRLPKEKLTNKIKSEIAFEFQEAVTDVLVYKTLKAAQKYKVKTVILGGGVAANKVLRQKLESALQQEKIILLKPDLAFSGDNAAMIALPAYHHYLKKDFISPFGFRPDPNWDL